MKSNNQWTLPNRTATKPPGQTAPSMSEDGSTNASEVRVQCERHPDPSLRFRPTAWAKLVFVRDLGETEVGGFAITAPDDLLFVHDIRLVKQISTRVSVDFDRQDVADFLDEQADREPRREPRPEQRGRIWVLTHPGEWANPSTTDEETFCRVLGCRQWAVMFILASGGKTYARLRFNVGPGGEIAIPVRVDYSQPFAASNQRAWEEEYLACVQPEVAMADRSPNLEPHQAGTREPFGADEDEYFNHWRLLMDDPFVQMEGVPDYPF